MNFSGPTNYTAFNTTLLPLNDTADGLCPVYHHATSSRVVKAIAYIILFVFSLVGNCVVLATVYRRKELRTVVNMFIANMAVSDLLVPVFIVPLELKNLLVDHGVWLIDGPFGLFLCKFVPFISWVTKVVSIMSLTVIAVERFHKVVLAHKVALITQRKCLVIILLTWFTAVGFFGFSFYTFRLADAGEKTYCIYSWEPAFNSHEADTIFFLLYMVCFVAIPLVLITLLYTFVLIRLRRQSSAMLNLGQERLEQWRRRNKRITAMLITVVVYFFITWIPWCIFLLVITFHGSPDFACGLEHAFFATLFLADSYSAANPVIYYLFNESFRQSFRELLCCRPIRVYKGRVRGRSWSSSMRGIFSGSWQRTLSILNSDRSNEGESAPGQSYKPRSGGGSLKKEEYELPILANVQM